MHFNLDPPPSQSPGEEPGNFRVNKPPRDFPGGPMAKTTHLQGRGPRVRSLVRKLDPTCHNEEFAGHS